MNGYNRTVEFLKGNKVDRPPFMPLAIDWVAVVAGIDQETFVYNPLVRAKAYLDVAREFNFDCVLPDSDFYEQLEDLGAKPMLASTGYHIEPIFEYSDELEALPVASFDEDSRMGKRLITLREVAKEVKGDKFIFGIVVGPFTEYCNARGMDDAMCDILVERDEAIAAVNFFHKNIMKFAKLQMEAGADGIQIVEPSCSLIDPKIYEELILPLHVELVNLVQQMGGVTRLHICGDTNKLIPIALKSGTNVLDVDKEVDMAKAALALNDNQFLCGNLSPATDILFGTAELIKEKVRKVFEDTNNRTIISAGCDIPPQTSKENMIAFYEACELLK